MYDEQIIEHPIQVPDGVTKRLVIRDPDNIPHVDKTSVEEAMAAMDQVGAENILEAFAGGLMLVEIAAHYGWPIRLFSLWVEKNISKDKWEATKKLCAESCAARGLSILSQPFRCADDVRLMTTMARQSALAAAQLDPVTWGKSAAPPVTGSMTIMMNMAPTAEFAGRVVGPREGEVVEAEVVPEENVSLRIGGSDG